MEGWEGWRLRWKLEQPGSIWVLLSQHCVLVREEAVGRGQEQPFLRVQEILSREDLMPRGHSTVMCRVASDPYSVFVQLRCLDSD